MEDRRGGRKLRCATSRGGEGQFKQGAGTVSPPKLRHPNRDEAVPAPISLAS